MPPVFVFVSFLAQWEMVKKSLASNPRTWKKRLALIASVTADVERKF
jgi:hypothetical protein